VKISKNEVTSIKLSKLYYIIFLYTVRC